MTDPISAQEQLYTWLDRCGGSLEADTWRWSVTTLIASSKGRVLAIPNNAGYQLPRGDVCTGETLTEAAERVAWDSTGHSIHEPTLADVVLCGVYDERRDVMFLCRPKPGRNMCKKAYWVRPRRLLGAGCRHPWRARAAFESLGWGMT